MASEGVLQESRGKHTMVLSSVWILDFLDM